MSKFFKALQQAEQDRVLRSRAERPGGGHEPPGGAPGRLAPPNPTDSPGPEGKLRGGADQDSEGLGERSSGIERVEEHLVALLKPVSFEAEQYRMLAHVVERFRESASVKVVGVTSPGAGDGKTLTALNLVGALGNARSRALLIEADLRQPTVARYLGLPDAHGGLVRAIAHPELPLADVVTRLSGFEFDVLTGGHPSAAPYDLLRSPRAEEIFGEARQAYDYVVVDTPPLVTMPEARVIERLVDGFLVVVRAHRTNRDVLREALRSLDTSNVLGFVFNGDDRLGQGHYRDYRYRARESSRNGRSGPR